MTSYNYILFTGTDVKVYHKKRRHEHMALCGAVGVLSDGNPTYGESVLIPPYGHRMCEKCIAIRERRNDEVRL